MIKRDFTAWDFVKQEPKKQGFTILGGVGDLFITDYPSMIIDTNSEWVFNTTAGTNNIILGGQNMTISADVSDTVYVQNLSVAGTTDIPPTVGQMRTIMDEDGYWSTQTFIITDEGGTWVTISRIESMITAGETFIPTQRVSIWTKFKNLFKKRA
jgi:hypothetical protein